ncbi:fumarylacetoacetate hydrolase family protein [Novosphingopyxis sp.]|uniref:fumarylacetoacetate hydrolase family protein n=1 Tax=Novosphingopyxis sp. TaxID=2709690 RepID=UPI003B5B622D
MRICRFNDNRVGLVEADSVTDVTAALDTLPTVRWPVPKGDIFISNLDALAPQLEAARSGGDTFKLSDVTLLSPVANPGKIIAAPLNYVDHVKEVGQDAEIHHNTHSNKFEGYDTPIDKLGLFLKSSSSVVGTGEGVERLFPERRSDHEVELALIVGKTGRNISEANALDHICGYCIGLDMTVRGPEDRSMRKSADSYTVLGPFMVTADEISNPSNLDMHIDVNDQRRQATNTSLMTVGLRRLIALASTWYELHPGDVILSGTPDGVGPVEPGDTMHSYIEGIGSMATTVR